MSGGRRVGRRLLRLRVLVWIERWERGYLGVESGARRGDALAMLWWEDEGNLGANCVPWLVDVGARIGNGRDGSLSVCGMAG